MCGIVGLLAKNPATRKSLGVYGTQMLEGMASRGTDSAGLAVYSDATTGDDERKLTLYDPTGSIEWRELVRGLGERFDCEVELTAVADHAVVLPRMRADAALDWILEVYPDARLLSVGRAIELYKDAGNAARLAERYGFREMTGSHLVGHTRMATESEVTWAHAHPFTVGEDFCLVHNGSLSNHHGLRRRLEAQGLRFATDNDTEAAARFFEWRLREGDDLEAAIRAGFEELDGFYTFLIGTENELAVVRDPFACKPAVVAETDDYVAIASEFRSLTGLPGVGDAEIYEPMPEEICLWSKEPAAKPAS